MVTTHISMESFGRCWGFIFLLTGDTSDAECQC